MLKRCVPVVVFVLPRNAPSRLVLLTGRNKHSGQLPLVRVYRIWIASLARWRSPRRQQVSQLPAISSRLVLQVTSLFFGGGRYVEKPVVRRCGQVGWLLAYCVARCRQRGLAAHRRALGVGFVMRLRIPNNDTGCQRQKLLVDALHHEGRRIG